MTESPGTDRGQAAVPVPPGPSLPPAAAADGPAASLPAVRVAPGPEPLLPERGQQDTDAAWGEYPAPDDDRLSRDRPPHWADF